MEVKPMTRYQRRAQRLRRLTAAREVRPVARMAGLDYRVSGESGGLVAHTHSLSWHRAKSPNITAPPPGQVWDRSGPARVVAKLDSKIAFPARRPAATGLHGDGTTAGNGPFSQRPRQRYQYQVRAGPEHTMEVINPSLMDPVVAAAIDESREDVKKPGIVTFVVNTSASMKGSKLQKATDGVIRFLDKPTSNNRVGVVTCNEAITASISVAPLDENGLKIADAVHKAQAQGGVSCTTASRLASR